MSRRRCSNCGGKFNPTWDEHKTGLCERCRSANAGNLAGANAGAISILPPAGSPLAKIEQALATPAVAPDSLLSRAASQFQSQREQDVINQVKVILERIASIERIQRKHSKQLILCRAQLAAISSGRYHVNGQTLRIVYDEELLNVPWDDTAAW